eukprot:TRINITY_DN10872_c0_g1_i6.p1 TRINITY_DN10872_c0_g1~~TRINITY_DN10872_c0_g1_i6.p1  ORF type:complete len:730 (-),score=102.34 TRINITY_DN10872_c0_g1_i6:54-2243(-)
MAVTCWGLMSRALYKCLSVFSRKQKSLAQRCDTFSTIKLATPPVLALATPSPPVVEAVTLRSLALEAAPSPREDGRSKSEHVVKRKSKLAWQLKKCRDEEHVEDILPFERTRWRERCPSGGMLLWTQMVVAAVDDDRPEWCVGRLFCGDGGIRFEEGSDSARWCGIASSFELSFVGWMDVSAVETVRNELIESGDFDFTDFRMDMCDLRMTIRDKPELGLSSSPPASALRFQLSFRLARLLQEAWVNSPDRGLSNLPCFAKGECKTIPEYHSDSELPKPPITTITRADVNEEESNATESRNGPTSSMEYHSGSELSMPPLNTLTLEDVHEKEVNTTHFRDVEASRNQEHGGKAMPNPTCNSITLEDLRENNVRVPASRNEDSSGSEVPNPPITSITPENVCETANDLTVSRHVPASRAEDHSHPLNIPEDSSEEAKECVTESRKKPTSEARPSIQTCTRSESSDEGDGRAAVFRRVMCCDFSGDRIPQRLRCPSTTSDAMVPSSSLIASDVLTPAEKPPHGPDFEMHLPAPTTLESIREALSSFDWPVNDYIAKQFKAKVISVDAWTPSSKQEGTWIRRLQCCIPMPKKIPTTVKSVLTLPAQVRATFVFRFLNRSETIIMVQECCFHEVKYSEYAKFQEILVFEQHAEGGVRFQKFADVSWASTSLPLALRPLKRFVASKTKTSAVKSGNRLAEFLAMDKDGVSADCLSTSGQAGATSLPQGKRKLAM